MSEYDLWIENNKLAKHPDIDNTGGWDVSYSEDGNSQSVTKNNDVDTIPTEIIDDFPYTHFIIKDLLSKFNTTPRRIRFSTLRKKKNHVA